jgi:hypothetical protein
MVWLDTTTTPYYLKIYDGTDWITIGSINATGNVFGTRFAKGANVASATALTLGTDGNTFDVTGTTAITSINTVAIGTIAFLHFSGAMTLTHHATNLILPGAANIVTASGDEAIFVEYGAGTWRCISYAPTALAPKGGNVFVVEERQTSGTNGGTFTFGADRTRVLNTSVSNTIAGASLGSNQVTLPAGVYRIKWSAPAYNVGVHQSFLYNITDTAEVARGQSSQIAAASNVQTSSDGETVLTITGTKAFEIRHRGTTTAATFGFGNAGSFGTEVYTRVSIEKIG